MSANTLDILNRITCGGAIIVARSAPCGVGEKLPPNRTTHYNTPAEAVASSDAGGNVYFAPATFSGSERKAAQATAVKAFWIDVDVREDKGFRTFDDALDGIKTFVERYNLPKPLLLNSGGGFHVYWCLTAPISVGVWKLVATSLHKLVTTHGGGLASDTARIKDVASLMRMPLSYNYTRGAAGTVVWDTETLVDLATFRAAINTALGNANAQPPSASTSHVIAPSFGAKPAHLGGTPTATPSAPTSHVIAPSFGAKPAHLGGTPTATPSAPTSHVIAPSFGAKPAHLGGTSTPPAAFDVQSFMASLPPPTAANPVLVEATTSQVVTKPTYAQVLSNCGLLRRMAEEPNEVSEPAWKFSVNILLQTEEGASAVHEFSDGYDGYDVEATNEKIAQVSVDRPVFCDTLRSVSGGFAYVCDACPNKNARASPIRNATQHKLLPRLPNERALENVKRTTEHAVIVASTTEQRSTTGGYWNVVPLNPRTKMQDPTIKLPYPPKGYIFGYSNTALSGVFAADDITTPLTEDLIFITKHVVCLDPVTSKRVDTQWGFSVIDTLGNTYEFFLAASDLVSVRELRSSLASQGIKYNASEELCLYMFAAIDALAHSTHEITYRVLSFGWYKIDNKPVFITPNAVLAASGHTEDTVLHDGDETLSCLAESSHSTGQVATLTQWCADYKTLFGNSPMVGWLTLASLASPLFYLAQDDGENMRAFGVVLSGGTGTGKSLISAACQSVWLKPRYISGNSSDAAIPKEAAYMRHLPLVVDDFTVSKRDTDKLRNLFLFITTGQERSKSLTGGTGLAQKVRWSNISIITTNLKVAELLQDDDINGGSMARLLEVAVGNVARSADIVGAAAAKRRLYQSNGSLGAAFIRKVLSTGLTEVELMVQNATTKFTAQLRSQKTQGEMNALRMRLRMVAFTFVVANLMKDLLPFDCNAALNWAVEALTTGQWAFGDMADGAVGVTHRHSVLRKLKMIIDRVGTPYKLLSGVDTSTESDLVTCTEAAAGLIGLDGLKATTVAGWVQGDNKILRSNDRKVSVIAAVDLLGELGGYYISLTELRDRKHSDVNLRPSDITEALGNVDGTGMPRKTTLTLDSSMTGGVRSVKGAFIWVSVDELNDMMSGV